VGLLFPLLVLGLFSLVEGKTKNKKGGEKGMRDVARSTKANNPLLCSTPCSLLAAGLVFLVVGGQ
jgi:hypothetical protein